MADLPTKDKPGYCSMAIYKRSLPGTVDIRYWVSESKEIEEPEPNAIDIITSNQTYYVHVDVELPSPERKQYCGSLCVDVDVDTCGPAPDREFDHLTLPLDPCGDGTYHFCFPLPPGTWDDAGFPNRCGRVYRICVTVGSLNACGEPGLIWGHCDSLEIAVHPAPAK